MAFDEAYLNGVKALPADLAVLLDVEVNTKDPDKITLDDIKRNRDILRVVLEWCLWACVHRD